jgi:hypothetical protein
MVPGAATVGGRPGWRGRRCAAGGGVRRRLIRWFRRLIEHGQLIEHWQLIEHGQLI